MYCYDDDDDDFNDDSDDDDDWQQLWVSTSTFPRDKLVST